MEQLRDDGRTEDAATRGRSLDRLAASREPVDAAECVWYSERPGHLAYQFGGDVRYLYAEPIHCVCIFIGTQNAYQDYRDILSRPLAQPDDVAPDYKTQASALLYGDVYDWDNLNQPDSIADYLRTYY